MCCKLGQHTYRNVTVTTKSKNYIFIMHSTGMENIKLAEVPPDIRNETGLFGCARGRTGEARFELTFDLDEERRRENAPAAGKGTRTAMALKGRSWHY